MDHYRIGVTGVFESAHHLRNYNGACERVHGHTWRVEVIIESGYDPAKGYGVDFAALQKRLGELTILLDHNHINDIPPFTDIEPTSEHLARWFHQEMRAVVETSGATIESVRVWEGPMNYAEYRWLP